MNLIVKRLLIGTLVGRVALRVRDYGRLAKSPKIEWGAMINDQIASRIAVGLCPAKGTFVDVGAHIGSIISEVLFHRPDANIIAFDAIPEKVDALRRKFPRVQVHCCALSDREGQKDFFVDLHNSGCSSLVESGAPHRQIVVDTKTLDGVLMDEIIDVLKIDVEGAELGVLRGSSGIIKRCRPVIMFESGPREQLGYTKRAMYSFLSRLQYSVFAPNRLGHTGSKMSLDAFLDSHEYPRRTLNYLALPDERADELRAIAATIEV